MPSQILFLTNLVLGYVACLLCFGVYVLPKLKSMERIEAQRVIATVHSFRFLGLVFILPGVVGPNLPAGFANFAAYDDFATGVLALLALLTVRARPLFWSFVVAFQSRWNDRRHPRRLPRRQARSSCAGGAVWRRIRGPNSRCADADDHALLRSLLAGTSAAEGSSRATGSTEALTVG
jgi:hypothetical protein